MADIPQEASTFQRIEEMSSQDFSELTGLPGNVGTLQPSGGNNNARYSADVRVCGLPGSDDKVPPTKKSKTMGSITEVKSTRFCLFKNMPFDVLFEICQYLRPGDLVNLCDASPLCWTMLCTKSAAFIWINSRELDDLYDIPDGMSEYHWAKLFYSTRCVECDIGKAPTPNFYMRRRLCNDCKGKKYISERTFGAHFGPNADIKVLRYIPSERLDYYSGAQYCKDVIVEQLKTLSALNDDLRNGKRDAYRKLERYKAFRSKLLYIMRAEAEYFRNATNGKPADSTLKRIQQRFLDLGYHVEDIPNDMKDHRLLRNADELTDERWRSIRDEFEPQFQAYKALREQDEWNELVLGRRELLDEAYVAHKLRCVPPPLWKFLPQVHHLIKLKPFHDLIESDKNRTLTADDFVPLLENLEHTAGPAYEEARARLRGQVLSSQTPFYSELKTSDKFQNLELSTLVFRCSHCKLFLFSWDDLRSHYCVHPSVYLENFDADFPYTFEFCEDGGDAMLLILSVLGLDPANTTISKLDATDVRFLCGHKHDNNIPRAFTWRGLVTHLLTRHKRKVKDKTMPPPKKIISRNRRPGLTQVKRLEGQIVNEYALWACAKCDKHLASGKLVNPTLLRKHLKDDHAIEQPHEGVEYVDLSDYRVFYELAKGLDTNRYDMYDD